MKYRYKIYGLQIQSDIKIAEAMEAEEEKEIDVTIQFGEMPKEIVEKSGEKSSPSVLRKTGAMFFRVPNVAEYLVEKSQITVSLMTKEDNRLVKAYILGSALGYCMVLRNRVVLHGGAIAYEKKGCIVTGESGAGKSTLTNALRKKGYQFIADDVCALDVDEQKTWISMAYPQQKLCRDAALAMGYNLSELDYINEERDKFAIRLQEGYLSEGALFRVLFELKVSDDGTVSCRKLDGHEKLMCLLRNIYRGGSAFEMWGVPPEYMKKCLQVASAIEVYEITRSKNENTLDELLQIVAEKIGEYYTVTV